MITDLSSAQTIKQAKVIAVGAMPPPIHGNAIVFRAFVESLKEKAEVVLADTSPGSAEKRLSYHMRRLLKVAGAICHLFLNRNSADVLYHNVDAGLGLFYSFAIVLVARILGYRRFLHHHTYGYLSFPTLSMKIFVRAAGKKATHIVLSEEMEQTIKRVYPAIVRTMAVGNARLIESAPKSDVKRGGPLVLGHLSRLEPHKGVLEVLCTFSEIARDGTTQLVLAGPVSLECSRAIDLLIKRYPDRVTLMGSVTGAKKVEFYEKIDVFLFPTQYKNEAQPLVILEALQYGRPCIAYARGVINEMLADSGGMVIQTSETFSEHALPLIASWRDNRSDLMVSSAKARSCFNLLSSRSERQMAIALEAIIGMPSR